MQTLHRAGILWTALVVVLVAVVALGTSDTGVADAAPNTINSTVTLSGTSPSDDLGGIGVFCDTCTPDDLFSCGSGCEIAAGVTVNVQTSVGWTAPAPIDTNYDTNQIRQGTNVSLSDTLTPGAGTITINYSIPIVAGLFGRNGDFPAGPDWTPSTDTISKTVSLSTSTACTPPLTGAADTVCSKSDEIPIFDTGDIFLGFGVKGSLVISHTFTVGPNGVTSHRIVSVTAGSVPDADLTWVNPVPSVVNDPFTVPCSAPVDSTVNYGLTNIQYSPSSLTVTGSLGLKITIEIPILPDADLGPFSIVSGTVFDSGVAGDLVMNGSPTPNLNLGPVLADNVKPIPNAGGPYSGNEGSPITFDGSGSTDNCASSLTYRWDFDDGGVAFGAIAPHTFADNSTHSGRLTVTDPSGNAGIVDFPVTVSNVNPTVNAGPDKQSDWGIPVSFHANGSDAGAVDRLSLLYAWNFNDPNDPVGAAGQDVSHVFSQPGTYNVVVTVNDKDGGSSTDTVQVTITPHDTPISYGGDVSGRITDALHFQATLKDEYGASVVGRQIDFKFDGVVKASALTDGIGVAQASWPIIPLGTTTGAHTVQASFAGDSMYNLDATGALSFTVSKEITVLTYTGPASSKPSKAVPLTAVLKDDEGNPISGKTILLTLNPPGSGTQKQSCSGITDASGTASCTIAKLTLKPGKYTLAVSFAGDGDYLSSSVTPTFSVNL
jgi:hypothetical protein